ncbi:cupin domain-containing protein [Planctomycetes bacterium CA13]
MPNLYADLPASLAEELVTTIAQGDHVRIERIVSTGHRSPPEYWYDQPELEWVIVLKGHATLEFEAGKQTPMGPGDHILITAHTKHRVESTSDDEPTVWLAVFFANKGVC